MFYVYEHTRPDTNAVFYVGKGKLGRAHYKRGRNAYWHRVVDKAGGFSVRMVAEGMDEELAFLLEEERIDQLRLLGVRLCNMTDGGEGKSGCIPSDETRRKMSESRKGKVASSESRRKMSEALTGRILPDETKRRLSEAHKGQVPTNGVAVQFDGMTFESIAALARYTGKKPRTVMARIRRNPQKYGYVVLQNTGGQNGMV